MSFNHHLHQQQLSWLLSHWSLMEQPCAVQIPFPILPSPRGLWPVPGAGSFCYSTQCRLLPAAWQLRGVLAPQLRGHRPVTAACLRWAGGCHWHSIGRGAMEKGGCPDFLPSLHSLPPGPAAAVASLQTPVYHNLTEQGCNSQCS